MRYMIPLLLLFIAACGPSHEKQEELAQVA